MSTRTLRSVIKYLLCSLSYFVKVLPENYYDRDQMKCVKDFLQFYNFEAPLMCFTTLWTDEPEGKRFSSGSCLNAQFEGPGCLNLRGSGEHTHFWREGDQTAGGHYHGDTSPQEVRGEGEEYILCIENL